MKRGRPKAASSRLNRISPGLVTSSRGRAVTARWDAGANHWLVLVEARQAAGAQLRIPDRAAFPAHPRMAEARADLQQPVVATAFDDVPACRPVAKIATAGLRPVCHELVLDVLRVRRRHECDASDRESQAHYSLHHDRGTPSPGWSRVEQAVVGRGSREKIRLL